MTAETFNIPSHLITERTLTEEKTALAAGEIQSYFSVRSSPLPKALLQSQGIALEGKHRLQDASASTGSEQHHVVQRFKRCHAFTTPEEQKEDHG